MVCDREAYGDIVTVGVEHHLRVLCRGNDTADIPFPYLDAVFRCGFVDECNRLVHLGTCGNLEVGDGLLLFGGAGLELEDGIYRMVVGNPQAFPLHVEGAETQTAVESGPEDVVQMLVLGNRALAAPPVECFYVVGEGCGLPGAGVFFLNRRQYRIGLFQVPVCRKDDRQSRRALFLDGIQNNLNLFGLGGLIQAEVRIDVEEPASAFLGGKHGPRSGAALPVLPIGHFGEIASDYIGSGRQPYGTPVFKLDFVGLVQDRGRFSILSPVRAADAYEGVAFAVGDNIRDLVHFGLLDTDYHGLHGVHHLEVALLADFPVTVADIRVVRLVAGGVIAHVGGHYHESLNLLGGKRIFLLRLDGIPFTVVQLLVLVAGRQQEHSQGQDQTISFHIVSFFTIRDSGRVYIRG